eukprot:3632278-Pleurochrysis_carterae.AAC.2
MPHRPVPFLWIAAHLRSVPVEAPALPELLCSEAPVGHAPDEGALVKRCEWQVVNRLCGGSRPPLFLRVCQRRHLEHHGCAAVLS